MCFIYYCCHGQPSAIHCQHGNGIVWNSGKGKGRVGHNVPLFIYLGFLQKRVSTQIIFVDTRHWVSLHCLIRSPADLAAVKQSDSIKFLYSDSSNWWEFRNPTFSPRPYSDHFPPLGRGKQWYSPQDKDVTKISRITVFGDGAHLKPPPTSIFALKNLLKVGI